MLCVKNNPLDRWVGTLTPPYHKNLAYVMAGCGYSLWNGSFCWGYITNGHTKKTENGPWFNCQHVCTYLLIQEFARYQKFQCSFFHIQKKSENGPWFSCQHVCPMKWKATYVTLLTLPPTPTSLLFYYGNHIADHINNVKTITFILWKCRFWG